MYNIGIDIGGTKIKIGVIHEDKVMDKVLFDTPIGDIDNLIEKIFEAVDDYMNKYEICNIGLGVAGQFENGLWHSDNIKVHDINLKELFENKYKEKKIYIANDVSAATNSELLFGNLNGVSSGIFITYGTGIGAGIVIDGKLYEGSSKNAGEIGHQIICINGKECTCGGRGCYEAYASTRALINNTKEMLKQKYEKNIDIEHIDGKEIFELYKNENKDIMQLINEHIKYMAYGIINIVNILDVKNIIIGGGISNEAEVIIPKLKEYISKYRTINKGKDENNIYASKFCNEAGIIGAANLYRL